jgi:hypothetical protein
VRSNRSKNHRVMAWGLKIQTASLGKQAVISV